jgi:hypothetical protein
VLLKQLTWDGKRFHFDDLFITQSGNRKTKQWPSESEQPRLKVSFSFDSGHGGLCACGKLWSMSRVLALGSRSSMCIKSLSTKEGSTGRCERKRIS